MNYLFKNAEIFTENGFLKKDILISGGKIFTDISNKKIDAIFDFTNCYILPGFVDVHVHFREPGFFYKESIETGIKAAAHGGFTDVCTMPNLKPAPDTVEHIMEQINLIKKARKGTGTRVHPFACITMEEKGKSLVNFKELKDYCIGFSDDGRGVQNKEHMEEALKQVKALDSIISAHCELDELNEKPYHGTTSASESGEVIRDIMINKEIGCKYHVCHVSSKESVEAIRKAKAQGINITCETAPHYLTFTKDEIKNEGRFKMNPPIREEADKQALIDGIVDGTVDMLATDHAPHSIDEKTREFNKCAFGVVGLETAFAASYNALVKTGYIDLYRLVELMSVEPRKRFNMPQVFIDNNNNADITIIDLNKIYKVNPDSFYSKGRATPFQDMELQGEILATLLDGQFIYQSDILDKRRVEQC